MKDLDLQAIVFVSASLVQEMWFYWGFPTIHYWDIKRKNKKK